MTDYVSKGADISPDGKYRFRLWREWRGTHDRKNWRWLGCKDGAGVEMGEPKSAMFVMLNPSTADGNRDDATIRRCVGFARAWNYELLAVVNLFPLRTRFTSALFSMPHDERTHWRSQEVIEDEAMRAGIIICAWGTHPMIGDQGDIVRGWMHDRKCYALGFTKNGAPRHPLYVPANARPVPMN